MGNHMIIFKTIKISEKSNFKKALKVNNTYINK